MNRLDFCGSLQFFTSESDAEVSYGLRPPGVSPANRVLASDGDVNETSCFNSPQRQPPWLAKALISRLFGLLTSEYESLEGARITRDRTILKKARVLYLQQTALNYNFIY